MKILRALTVAMAFMFIVSATVAEAAVGVIYGPVYISKTKKHDGDKKSKFVFTAPVAGAGVVVVRNGGDSGKKARVSSAKIELNDQDILSEQDLNKTISEVKVDVQLKDSNEMEVKVKSCNECEIAVTVYGELAAPPAPPAPAPPVPAPPVPAPIAPAPEYPAPPRI